MADRNNIVRHPGTGSPAKTGQSTPESDSSVPVDTPKKPGANPQRGRKMMGNKKNRKAAGEPPAKPVIKIRPMAQPATMRRRHWGIILGFFIAILAPLALTAYYLWFVSTDQYASTTGFTVRQEETSGASDILGGLAAFSGSSSSQDSDILYGFIQSQQIVATINERINLTELYSSHWDNDPVFSLWPDASIEDLLWYWGRMVQISYDQGTGLIEFQVLAFSPNDAQLIASEIIAESQQMINQLNAQARADVMGYAEQDLNTAVERLKSAREALTLFRTSTQIVDPEADIQGRMGVLNNLQQQLAEALIEYDLLLDTSNPGDPRLNQASRRIDVIRDRISSERETFAANKVEVAGEDYPTLIARFESLTVDREFAEEAYRAALTAHDAARTEATRQSRYLATYIGPTIPQTSEYPQRPMIIGLLALFLLLAWTITSLIYYSIRDRR